MDFSKRQKQILDRLRPKPLHHGQLETELIAVPNLKSEDIAPERWQVLRDSFVQEGSNLIPLIVRRSDAYENEEYEVIYGGDWCLVARELDIERLWVWVFDLNDEQAAITKSEMELLLGDSMTPTPPPDEIRQIGSLLQRLENSLEKKINQQISSAMEGAIAALEKTLIKQIDPLRQEVAQLSRSIAYSSMTVDELKKLATERQLKGRSGLKKGQLIDLHIKADQQTSS